MQAAHNTQRHPSASPTLTCSCLPPASPSVQELVLKDHALEPDSEALRRSAHLMVTGLAQVRAGASLA